jgi:hypothetical protein
MCVKLLVCLKFLVFQRDYVDLEGMIEEASSKALSGEDIGRTGESTYCYTLFGNLGCDLLQTCWRRCCNIGRNVRRPTGETRKKIAVGNASDRGD